MQYMLDSSACIKVLRGHSSPAQFPAPAKTAISAIVAAELWTGVEKAARRSHRKERLQEFLSIFSVLDFTHEAAKRYGEIRSVLEQRGEPIGPMDLLIAAHALSVNAILITANASEFQRAPELRVLVWK
jgi:tRNA(fMet)-specific endonuclease VapC